MAKTYNRQVALDTETTGMDIEAGNRLISIGCVEIVGRSITKRTFYKLIVLIFVYELHNIYKGYYFFIYLNTLFNAISL